MMATTIRNYSRHSFGRGRKVTLFL